MNKNKGYFLQVVNQCAVRAMKPTDKDKPFLVVAWIGTGFFVFFILGDVVHPSALFAWLVPLSLAFVVVVAIIGLIWRIKDIMSNMSRDDQQR